MIDECCNIHRPFKHLNWYPFLSNTRFLFDKNSISTIFRLSTHASRIIMDVIESSSCWEFPQSEIRIWAASSSFVGYSHPDVKCILRHVFCYRKNKRGEHKLFRDMIYLEIFFTSFIWNSEFWSRERSIESIKHEEMCQVQGMLLWVPQQD